jgi:hypothetical protein
MKDKTIIFTKKELRALNCFLFLDPCESGCAFGEFQNDANIQCSNCPFTKIVEDIKIKLDVL